MRILYLSCHEILEFDEVSLFNELGYEIFSPGAYVCPDNPGGNKMRPKIPGLSYDKELADKWSRHDAIHPSIDGKSYLTKEIVDDYDVVIVMHIPEWISKNWDAIKHKRVIWRTIGQSVASTENHIRPYKQQGLEIVRYSPKEAHIPGFAGQDGLIRFFKDPEVYKDWNGETKQVVTFAQHMKTRGSHCSYDVFQQATAGYPRKLFGPGNDEPGFGMGKVPYERLIQELRDNRAYFYTGTHPASYTLNFIESWMTGIPLVAIGPHFGNAAHLRNHNLYETHELIEHGVTGFVSDNIFELKKYVAMLLHDHSLAKKIGDAGRAEAIRHFGKDLIKGAWKAYLER